MKTKKYICTNCKMTVELSMKPNRSFIGFLRIPCLSCKREFRYPLTTGYVIFYWILLVAGIAWMTYILSQGGVADPIGIIILIYVIISLVKSRTLSRQIAELHETMESE